MPLKVIDKTGRLSKNPKDWPAELRRAIAECCCGDSSSDSSTVKHFLSCCSARVGDLCVTITGASLFGGATHRLTYRENELVHEDANLFTCTNSNQIRKNGWFGDWLTPCPGGNELRLALFEEPIPGLLSGCVPGYVIRSQATLGNCTLTTHTAHNSGGNTFPLTALVFPCQQLPGDGIVFQCNPFILVYTGPLLGCNDPCVRPSSMIVTECQ